MSDSIPRPAHRPVKLDQRRRDLILLAIGAGMTRSQAARNARITPRTLRNWLERAKRGESEFVQLEEDMKRIEAGANYMHLDNIANAGKSDWRASAWWLERRYPEQFGRQRREIAELKQRIAELEQEQQRQLPNTLSPPPIVATCVPPKQIEAS